MSIHNRIFLYLAFIFLMSCKSTDVNPVIPETVSATLRNIKISTWMYQIQDLDETSAIDELGETPYDMLVVEPGHNFKNFSYPTSYLTSKLSQKPDGIDRLLLAYIDIGQAEDYRTYWASDWVAPTATSGGTPDFLVTIDPDGWSGNFPVAYWDTAWQNIWLEDGGIIEKLVGFGFQGVYLDWVEAYDDDKVIEKAKMDHVSPAEEMIDFIGKIRQRGRSLDPDFVAIAQNAPYLLDANPTAYKNVIDAISTEDTWYYGEGDADWDSDQAGDLLGGERQTGAYSTDNRIEQNKKYLDLQIPVFTVDYCISKTKATATYQESRKNGFIPLVTRVALSRITETPPF